ncbi:MAG TPA: fatty acid desaturase family protein [Dongiaceae bacterium]|nr:fatty acid desaturase family protein [Dongiaceae bacterium]
MNLQTAAAPRRRNYSLVGPDARAAVESGLAGADWYRTEIPRKVMKELMQRSDAPAIRDTLIWLAAIAISAGGSVHFWGSWWCLPFLVVYGVLYGSSSDSRWHECGHGTAFRTRWMNDVIYEFASFMILRNSVTWRWSHARHHTDTIIVGRDIEISVQRPPNLWRVALVFVGLPDAVTSMAALLRNACGHLSAEERDFIPVSEHKRAVRVARCHIAVYVVTVALAVYFRSWLPVVMIGLPRLYGAWHGILTGLLQHGGLADNVTDHRLNSRTVLINPVSRFIYWNMNYHIEHHMFPMVPYHALPRLYALIKDDLPAANPSMWHGYAEMIPVLLRQRREPDYYLRRPLPPTARPYLDDSRSKAA